MSKESKQIRADYIHRAGTHLQDPEPVWHTPPQWARSKERQVHGFIDRQAGVFQGGGERTEILFTAREPALMSFLEDVWQRITVGGGVTRIEMIDHGRNEVLTVDVETARQVAIRYTTAQGVRWGIPVTFITTLDNEGRVVKAPATNAPTQDTMFGNMDVIAARKKSPTGNKRQ